MFENLGERQQQILRSLLRAKSGQTIDELVASLGITRTAVTQHIAVLEREGLIEPGNSQSTGGRPKRRYVLTEEGIERFPKRYSWFSALLLSALRHERGPAGLAAFLDSVADTISEQLEARLNRKSEASRLREVVAVMNELAYDARLATAKGARGASIEASNCVYHQLAVEHPELCEFDRSLLQRLTHRPVKQEECIIKGDNVCRFRLEQQDNAKP